MTIDNKDNGDTLRLRVPDSETVAAVVDTMYSEFRLTRETNDRLTCQHGGTDVYQYSALTIAEYLPADPEDHRAEVSRQARACEDDVLALNMRVRSQLPEGEAQLAPPSMPWALCRRTSTPWPRLAASCSAISG